MANELPEVLPGQIITAEAWNALVRRLSQPVQDVKPIHITDVKPHQVVAVDSAIEVRGENFDVPAENNVVTIGGVRVQQFGQFSESGFMRLTIPAVTDLDVGGAALQLVIKNHTGGIGTATLLVKPKVVVPTGTLTLWYDEAPVIHISITPPAPPVLTAEHSYVFGFTLANNLKQDASCAVSAKMDRPGWTATVLEDGTSTKPAEGPLAIRAGVNRRLRILVSIPKNAQGQEAGLTLDITENTPNTAVIPAHAGLTITEGKAPPTPHTEIVLGLRSVKVAEIEGSTVKFEPEKPGTITFNLWLAGASQTSVKYSFAVTPRNTSAGWSVLYVDKLEWVVAANTETDFCDLSASIQPSKSGDNELVIIVTRDKPPLSVTYVQAVAVR